MIAFVHVLAGIGASRHDVPILGRVTSRHALHVMTRHRLAVLHQRFFTLSIIPVFPVSLLYLIHMTYTCTHA
jgi:hypothetical protein